MDLEEVWRLREEEVYPKLFGPLGRGIFPLTQELFNRRFGCALQRASHGPNNSAIGFTEIVSRGTA